MRCEIVAVEELDSLSREWHEEVGLDNPRVIQRIEDLPCLENLDNGNIDWVVDGMIAAGAMHLITGDAGAGKSTLVSAMGHAVSRGDEFLERATSKRPVLLLDAENPIAAVGERFRRLGIESHDGFRVWGQWVGEDPPAAGGDVVMEWVARCEPSPLVIIDSLIAFNPGAENDSSEMRRYLAQYRKLAAAGATVVLLHHIGKSETARDYRGSSDIKASIDIGYKLTNLGDCSRLSLLELKAFKQRFSVVPMLHLRYEDGNFAVDGREFPTTVSPLPASLCELLKLHPGVTGKDFEKLAAGHGHGRNQARSFLTAGVKQGTIHIKPGPCNRNLHFWRGPDEINPLNEGGDK
jgi:energy-coupling factor transporter ATP-binding protein EcfA2